MIKTLMKIIFLFFLILFVSGCKMGGAGVGRIFKQNEDKCFIDMKLPEVVEFNSEELAKDSLFNHSIYKVTIQKNDRWCSEKSFFTLSRPDYEKITCYEIAHYLDKDKAVRNDAITTNFALSRNGQADTAHVALEARFMGAGSQRKLKSDFSEIETLYKQEEDLIFRMVLDKECLKRLGPVEDLRS